MGLAQSAERLRLLLRVDRLSRNQNHIGVLFDEVEQAGAQLQFVTERFEDTFSLVAFVAYCLRRFRRLATASYLVMFIVLVAWWSMIEPSHDREWQPEIAVLPYATFNGDLITVHNIRNFDYQTETDFTVTYDDRTYDLTKLDSVDPP